MILSDKQLIFVHIRKTGGLSVEAAFCWGGSWKGKKFNVDFNVKSAEERHFTSTEIRQAYPKEWEDYVTFAIVRNPFDRLLSMYMYLKDFKWYPEAMKDANRLQFNEWVLQILKIVPPEALLIPQCDYLKEDIDHIFRFEEFHEVEKFLQGYGVVHGLHRLNGTSHGSYREYYDDASREFVEKIYNKDLVRFEYEF